MALARKTNTSHSTPSRLPVPLLPNPLPPCSTCTYAPNMSSKFISLANMTMKSWCACFWLRERQSTSMTRTAVLHCSRRLERGLRERCCIYYLKGAQKWTQLRMESLLLLLWPRAWGVWRRFGCWCEEGFELKKHADNSS